MQKCKGAKVQRCKCIKARRYSTVLYNSLDLYSGTELFSGMVLHNGAALLNSIVLHHGLALNSVVLNNSIACNNDTSLYNGKAWWFIMAQHFTIVQCSNSSSITIKCYKFRKKKSK